MDLQTRTQLVKFYYKSKNDSAIQALYSFCTHNNLKKHPCSPLTVTRLVERFEATGSVEDLPRSGRPSVSDDTISQVKTYLITLKSQQEYGICSSAAVSRDTQVPHSTVKKILRQYLEMKPYHIRRVQKLEDSDHEKRLVFANFFIQQCEIDVDYAKSVLWTDEAHFFLDGCVYTRNCVIWDDQNPHVLVTSSLHPEKVTVWAGFTGTQQQFSWVCFM